MGEITDKQRDRKLPLLNEVCVTVDILFVLFKLMVAGVTGEAGVPVTPKQAREKEGECATAQVP